MRDINVYVAGHTGLVGSALTRALDRTNGFTWSGKRHSELDLTDRSAVFAYVERARPDAAIIAAAKVGGIIANRDYPVDFLSINLQIQTNLLDAFHQFDVKKVLFLGSSCIYPKHAHQPISEGALLTGPLEETNAAYAIAKIAGVKLVDAYRNEFGRDWASVMPTNLYGPNDNFHATNSHVIPGLLGKFHEAVLANSAEVTLWGTGNPLREFLHSDDLADACLTLLQTDLVHNLINVGSGFEISIKNLAELIARISNFRGEIKWDESKPDGTPRKLLESNLIRSYGWKPRIDLQTGLKTVHNEKFGN